LTESAGGLLGPPGMKHAGSHSAQCGQSSQRSTLLSRPSTTALEAAVDVILTDCRHHICLASASVLRLCLCGPSARRLHWHLHWHLHWRLRTSSESGTGVDGYGIFLCISERRNARHANRTTHWHGWSAHAATAPATTCGRVTGRALCGSGGNDRDTCGATARISATALNCALKLTDWYPGPVWERCYNGVAAFAATPADRWSQARTDSLGWLRVWGIC
jgi:hypothetical protein